MSASPTQFDGAGRRDWRPIWSAALIVAAAFALGLLLFALLWSRQRHGADVYRATAVAPTSQAPVFAPLPAPMPAGQEDGASGLPEPDERALAERPRIVERPSSPAAATPAQPAPAPAPVAASNPVPVSSPAPLYPRSALRRRESGTVRVRVDVGPDGAPTATSVVESSHSRELDRAALDAVRRWRFRPAMADGRPVGGSVVVPIDFKL